MMDDPFLRAHMARKRLNETGLRYGGRDLFDLWCLIGCACLLVAAGLWIPVQ